MLVWVGLELLELTWTDFELILEFLELADLIL